MGFRFRKSMNFGPFRLNFSKSGVGYSFGGKGFRVTKKAGGGTRTTASIPGTGISYVKDSTSGKKKSSKHTSPPAGAANYTPSTSGGKKRRKWPYIVAAVLVVGMIGSCMQNDDTDPTSSSSLTPPSSASSAISEPEVQETPVITSISLDCDQAIQLDIKDAQSIPVLVLEEGADASNLEFISSAPEILTFAPQEDNALVGIASPKAEGTAEISVSAGDITSQVVTVTVIDSERIAAEEAAKKAAEEEAARKAAEEAAAQQAAQEQQQNQQSQQNSRTVYVTPTGKKYHYDNNCNGGTYIESTLDEALSMGLTPCKKCAGG